MEIEQLIEKFESGDTPTGQDFADLIRYCYNSKYKIVKRNYDFNINANETTSNIPMTVDLGVSSIDVYLANSLLKENLYELSYNDGTLTLTVSNSVPTARSGFIRVNTIEEV